MPESRLWTIPDRCDHRRGSHLLHATVPPAHACTEDDGRVEWNASVAQGAVAQNPRSAQGAGENRGVSVPRDIMRLTARQLVPVSFHPDSTLAGTSHRQCLLIASMFLLLRLSLPP